MKFAKVYHITLLSGEKYAGTSRPSFIRFCSFFLTIRSFVLCQCILKGVYLLTENGATDGARELLKSKISELGYPLHTVSYNSTDEHTIRFLRELAQCSSGGRFHAFSVSQTDVDPLTGEVSYYGGTPSGKQSVKYENSWRLRTW